MEDPIRDRDVFVCQQSDMHENLDILPNESKEEIFRKRAHRTQPAPDYVSAEKFLDVDDW